MGRASASARGYGTQWRDIRAEFLAAHPWCTDCGHPARHADHAPVSRVQLVLRGDPNPNAWHHLQARCPSCHSRRTARVDGGYGNGTRPTLTRTPEPHPGVA